jgi:hypothetical protein
VGVGEHGLLAGLPLQTATGEGRVRTTHQWGH